MPITCVVISTNDVVSTISFKLYLIEIILDCFKFDCCNVNSFISGGIQKSLIAFSNNIIPIISRNQPISRKRITFINGTSGFN
ncbi:unnamed protein product [Schistosoma margrebowiei]|uniref:Uncharacterized protein n=1 Tax=Schistosoma margrebowiei TaxID=48269 RepID=A0A3P8ACT4_9TREM|nr:unnamed protein product [Schistosoma margrebowiei]